MSEETDVSVGDDVVTDIPAEEGKTEEAEVVAGDEPKNKDASTEGDTDQEKEPEKPEKNRVQKRIDEYAKKTHDALREAEYWKQKALSSEGTKRELAEHEAEKADAKVASVSAESWQAKIEAAREVFSDYDEVVSKSTAHVEPHVAKAVLESDIGPQIFRHLAKNPEVLEKLNGMTERAGLKELGRLEDLLQKPEKETTPVKKVSTAPEPVKPVGSNRGVVQKNLADMSQAEYEAHRRKNGAKW
jgi:hypothetical protein